MNTERHLWVVDSIEEGVATIEDDETRILHVPRWLLPEDVREGVVLSVTREPEADGAGIRLTIRVDREETERAIQRSQEQVSRTSTNDAGGDIVL